MHLLTTPAASASCGYSIWRRTFESGHVEVSAMWQDEFRKISHGKRKKAERGKSANRDASILVSSRRAKRRIRHAAHQIVADHMLTLTYRANQTDIKQAWKDFRKFSAMMRKKYGNQWAYVIVPEYQERGAVHFHLALHGFWPVTVLRHYWRKVIGEGNVDMKYFKTGARVSTGKMASYLAKYVGKAIGNGQLNAKSYNVSQGIKSPPAEYAFLPYGVPVLKVMRQLIESITPDRIRQVWWGHNQVAPVFFMST